MSRLYRYLYRHLLGVVQDYLPGLYGNMHRNVPRDLHRNVPRLHRHLLRRLSRKLHRHLLGLHVLHRKL
jgi:hypothetical protein